MFDKLIAKVKAEPKTIVFTEGVDARIQEAASKLLAEKLMGVILVGVVDEVKKTAAERGFNIEGAQIIDPATYEGMDEMVDAMVALRKGKMSPEDCKANLLKGNYFGTMLVKMGKADCLLGGATYSTADTVRPALQLVKTKPGAHLVSSCFILNREDGPEELRTIAMGDCAINIDYQDNVDKEGNVTFTAGEKLAEVAEEIYKVAPTFGIDPKLAMLSFSTKGSGKGGTVSLSQAAIKVLKEKHPDWNADGEMQVAGYANTFVFPCIEAGNIGYKIAQRLGGYAAYGPISLGLNAPINDLSRGCDADEVYKMAIITAAL